MKIEAGKDYLQRNGWRWRCYSTEGTEPYPLLGAILTENGWVMERKAKDGLSQSEVGGDVIAKWVDKPEVDWSLYSKWDKCIIQAQSGHRYVADVNFVFDPVDGWINYGEYRKIPAKYRRKISS